ncbi:MAG: sigma-70 family RNA polymerase sigma factor [Fimbriimonadaceae bacterium]|nr:sigma-70 family RNA polymerase sigma factor [Fimbriimonadaceae bacterium]
MSDPTRSEDLALVRRVQRGDAAALDLLVERYHGPLSQFLERLLGDAETAREVTQETFLRMMGAVARYQPRAKFSTWLYTIATNLARDELRRRQTRASRATELDDADREPLAEPPTPLAEAALAQLERDDIRRALRSLSADHREAVVLHYYQGLSYKEIASVCGCTVGTVGSRIHYAVRHLRRHLGVQEQAE